MPPAGIKTAGIKTRERVHYSGVTRLHTFKAECPCGLWVQGINETKVKRTMALHQGDCAEARQVSEGKADPRVLAKKARAKGYIDTYVPPAQRDGAGS